MLVMFNAVFAWAKVPMGGIESGVGLRLGAGRVEHGRGAVPLACWSTGIIGGIGSVVIFLPQIVILFFFMADAGRLRVPRPRGVPDG